jgi:hypothetical protein
MGFKVNRFDNEVLGYSRLKAVADIATIEAEVKDLESELAADVKQRKEQLENIKEQFKSTTESLASRKSIYRIKLDQYFKGETTVDNLLQAFRSLVETEKNYQWVGIDHYFNIVALDYYCGVYFKKLGITVE